VDVVLHCSGAVPEMRAVAEAAPELAGRARERAVAALKRLKTPEPFDGDGAWMELTELCRRADWPPAEV
jgi:hypothetical protein